MFQKLPFPSIRALAVALVTMTSIVNLGSETLWTSLSLQQSDSIVAYAQSNKGDEDRLKMIARQTTVQLRNTEQNALGESIAPGSGVLIAQKDNTYYVLTCFHVVGEFEKDTNSTPSILSKPVQVTTPDGQKHQGQVFRDKIIYQGKQVDLAVVTFKSNRKYRTAEMATSLPNIYERRSILNSGNVSTSTGTSSSLANLKKFPVVIVAGFPLSTTDLLVSGSLQTSAGYLVNTTASAFSLSSGNERGRGYRLMYTNLTRVGMSGGPVFNGDGQVIGIHGMSDGTTKEDDAGQNRRVAYNLSMAIPTPIFVRYGAKDIPIKVKVITNTEKGTKEIDLTAQKWPSPNVHDAGTVSYDLEEANQAWRLGDRAKSVAVLAKALGKVDANSSKKEDILAKAEILFLAGFSAGWYRDFNTAYDKCKEASELVERNQDLERILRLESGQKDKHQSVLNLGYRSWRCRAGAALRRENPDLNEALTSIERAIEINRFGQEAKKSNLADQRQATWDNLEAATSGKKAAQVVVENPNDYLERGQILMYQQEFAKATSSFRLALELDPDFWMPRIELAFAYLETDRIDDAEKEARTILNQSKTIDPANPYGPSYTLLVRVQMKRNDLNRALATINEGLKWVKNDPSLHDDQGVILASMGRTREARAAFNRALKIDPNYVDAIKHLEQIGEI